MLREAGPKKKRIAAAASGSGLQPPPASVEPEKVWLTLERKYRVAEYESMTVNLGASTSVDPGEDLSAAARRLAGIMREEFYEVVSVMRDSEGL